MSKAPAGSAQYLDHGFVKILGVFGSDKEIEEAARVSYSGGDETRKVSDTRNLLRYLMRHEHTSPFEMAEVKFVLRVPIFVMRQLVRHRTASLNEYSGRYSEMTDDCYMPAPDRLLKQSTTNKQGSAGELDPRTKWDIDDRLRRSFMSSFDIYRSNLYTGLAKETARINLPVSNYTELYWKCDLNNFFRFLRLRLDAHAQWEIRELAQLMYDAAKPHFPISFEAFEDYQLKAVKFSSLEMRHVIAHAARLQNILESQGIDPGLSTHIENDSKLSAREKDELKEKLRIR